MGQVFSRALQAAGLCDCQERALSGAGLPASDIARLRSADLLLVASLADAVRERFRGDEVQVIGRSTLQGPNLRVFDVAANDAGPTGAELLFELSLLRLATPGAHAIAVSFDALGLELAQTALLFGADTLFGDLGGKRTLPLLDGPAARRLEIEGLVARSGRRARFVDEVEPVLEQHP